MKKPNYNLEKVLSILVLYPELNREGIRYNIQLLKDIISFEVIYNKMLENRQYLVDRCDFIVALSEFLQKKIEKTLTIRDISSYNIKHICEKNFKSQKFGDTSISNGELITAALLAGFECKPIKDSPNVYFNMAQESIKNIAIRR